VVTLTDAVTELESAADLPPLVPPGPRPYRLPAFLGLVACWLPCFAWGQGPPPAPVQVERAEERAFTPTAFVISTTEPRRRSVVAAAIEGYVIDFPIDEGARVKKGDVLARLRDNILRLRLKEAQAALEEVREKHASAKRDVKRAQQLDATDSVTKKDLDERSTLERTLALQIVRAEAEISILEAEVTKKTVVAPFAGQIVKEHTEVGEWLARGGPVGTLVDISTLVVRVNVPERYLRFLDEGASVDVRAAAAGTEPFAGTVLSISDEGDPASHTFAVRVLIKRTGRLRAGMSAQVEVPAGEPIKALVVSKDAILLQGTQSFVFVVGKDNRADRRRVTTGPSSGSTFAVLSGIAPGEMVVVKGNERIQPGAPVRIVPGTGTPVEQQPVTQKPVKQARR
jgi:membrane fusion protein (multidrug efflux system)